MKVLHYKTQMGQPYGSESRKCSRCGIMIWTRLQPLWTDDEAVWKNPPEGFLNCDEEERRKKLARYMEGPIVPCRVEYGPTEPLQVIDELRPAPPKDKPS